MLTYITNLEVGPIDAKATTQRTNFDFNSFLEIGGNVYGLKSTGLYRLGGDTDDGTNIDAYFATGSVPLSGNPTRLRYGFITMETDGSVYLTVTPNKITASEYTKNMTPTTANFHRYRVKLGEGLKAGNWGFKFGNTDGSYFSVSVLEVEPTAIPHREREY